MGGEGGWGLCVRVCAGGGEAGRAGRESSSVLVPLDLAGPPHPTLVVSLRLPPPPSQVLHYCNEKAQLAQQVYDYVDARIRRLDTDLAAFDAQLVSDRVGAGLPPGGWAAAVAAGRDGGGAGAGGGGSCFTPFRWELPVLTPALHLLYTLEVVSLTTSH